ncbi:MAG: MATE family efflux transporter [Bacilli bacterium]|nr:MATE family efflux transporter [Bacilli bacterium]
MKDMTKEFSSGKILPLVFKLTIPAVIAQLITFLYNIVDRMYVSNIEGIKTEALAALGIVLPITIIVQAFANLIGLGGSPKASMKLGEGKNNEANNIFNNATSSLFFIGLLMTIILFVFAKDIVILFGCPINAIKYATDYLKIYALGSIFIIIVQGLNPFISAEGHALLAMLTTLIGAILNIILDPIFIFTFSLGVKGASIATILSQFVSFVWVLIVFFQKESIFKFNIKEMKLKKEIMLGILFLGLSPFIMTFTESLIQIVFNVCLKLSTGGESSDYTAALTIMLSALQLISLPLNGLGYGIAPFVSYNYGKGDGYRLKKGIKYTFIIALIFVLIVYSISMLFPIIYARLFNASDSVTLIIKQYTPLFLMGSIMFCVQMTLQNVNVALGQGKTAVILATLRKVVILIPLCFILSNLIGFKGVYLSEGIADLVAGIITSIVIFTTFPKVINKRVIETQK